jgi:hypothetical protein
LSFHIIMPWYKIDIRFTIRVYILNSLFIDYIYWSWFGFLTILYVDQIYILLNCIWTLILCWLLKSWSRYCLSIILWFPKLDLWKNGNSVWFSEKCFDCTGWGVLGIAPIWSTCVTRIHHIDRVKKFTWGLLVRSASSLV